MNIYLLALLAGFLTVLSPCVFALLPIILGTSISTDKARRPLLIIFSLAVSIIIFTLLLRASTLLIMIPSQVWQAVSGVILFLIGISLALPNLWTQVNVKLGLSSKSDNLLNKASKQEGMFGDILTGVALGPVFTSCSPTYGLLVAIILPQNFTQGLISLIIYTLGLSAVLLIVALTGQRAVIALKWALNPQGVFRKAVGILLIIFGLMIAVGLEKKIETYLLDSGFPNLTNLETDLSEELNP